MSEEQVRALIAACDKLHHWHDWGRNNEGMVVSHDVVFEIWKANADIKAAVLAQAQPAPQMAAMQMLQKCLAVVVGYEHTLSWPNHPNNEDMQAAAMDTTIAIEDAMLKLREEIGEAQPVADAPNDQLIFNGVVYVRAGAQPPAEGLREQLAKEYYEYNVGNSLGIKFEQMGPEAQNAFRKQADNWLPIVQSVLLARVPQAAPTQVRAVSDTTAISGSGENLRDKSPQLESAQPTGQRHAHAHLPDDPDMCCSCLWVCECEPIPSRHDRAECERQWRAHVAKKGL